MSSYFRGIEKMSKVNFKSNVIHINDDRKNYFQDHMPEMFVSAVAKIMMDFKSKAIGKVACRWQSQEKYTDGNSP